MAEYEGDCVFCGIITGTEAATVIREWPDAVAFVPLGPVVPGGHTLVVPRQHVANAVQDPAVTAATMLRAVELASEYEFSNILTSTGRPATQSVFHLHLHVIRRTAGDQLMVPWGTTGNPQDPHSCKRSKQAEAKLAAANGRAETLRKERDQLAQVADQRGAFAANLSAQLDAIGQVKPEWSIGDTAGPWTIDRYTEAAARASAPGFGDGARPIRRLAGEWRDAE